MSKIEEPKPIRIIVIGNFSGTNLQKACHITVDSDNFVSVMKELTPQLLLHVKDKLSSEQKDLDVPLRFTQISAFEPESIIDNIPSLKTAIEARDILSELLIGECLLADAKARMSKLPVESIVVTKANELLGELNDSNEEILERSIKSFDNLINSQIDEILHQSSFQRLESAWRGLKRLVDDASSSTCAKVELLNVDRSDMDSEFTERVYNKDYLEICQSVITLILANFVFSHSSEDVDIIKTMAEKAANIQAVFVASMSPEFFGFRNTAHLLAIPDLQSQLTSPVQRAWINFTQTEPARWVCMTINRFLLREPYKGSSHLEPYKYTESVSESKPESFLWGSPIWLVGFMVINSFRETEACFKISGFKEGMRYPKLPARLYPVSAKESGILSVEVPLTGIKVNDFLNVGLTPLNGVLNWDTAYFPLCTNAYRVNGITLNSTLEYHLYIAQILHQYYLFHHQIPQGTNVEDIKTMVQRKIYELISPFGGDNPNETIQVDVLPTDTEGLYTINIHVKPDLEVASKEIEFSLSLQLQVL